MSKVKHIVLWKFKDGTSEELVNKFFDDLLDLSETVPGIDDYVSGANCGGQDNSQGLTHGFIMTFTDIAARDAYLVHPEHEKFKAAATSLVDNVVIFDFEV
jgi:hypothetical protein